MNVDMFTRGDWIDEPAKARTQHQPDCAVLCIERRGQRINLYGDRKAFEAFDKIAALFNEAHPQPTPEQVAAKTAEDDDFPF